MLAWIIWKGHHMSHFFRKHSEKQIVGIAQILKSQLHVWLSQESVGSPSRHCAEGSPAHM